VGTAARRPLVDHFPLTIFSGSLVAVPAIGIAAPPPAGRHFDTNNEVVVTAQARRGDAALKSAYYGAEILKLVESSC
jgi:hypothetical protein